MTIPSFDERLFQEVVEENPEIFKRKLAYVVKIETITPIEKADFVELVTFENLGWQAVAKKGQFQVGDFAVYFETDSLLEDVEEFEFMRVRKFRVKQIKLRKTYSNGLVMPFNELTSYKLPKNLKDGDDLTDILNVKHYQKVREEQKATNGRPKKWSLRGWIYFYVVQLIEYLIGPINGQAPFPVFIPKTDEPRLEHVKGKIARHYEGQHANVTIKMHGQSMTVYNYKGKTGICSRNLELLSMKNRDVVEWKMTVAMFIAKIFKVTIDSNESNSYWQVTKDFLLLETLVKYCWNNSCNLALQLEVCGPSINGNMYNFEKRIPFLFSIWDIDKKRYFTTKELYDFSVETNIQTVHLVKGYHILSSDINYYLNYFKEVKPIFGSKFEEGLVVRDDTGLISFKVINPDYKNIEDSTLGIE
jgi:hypothetical protein